MLYRLPNCFQARWGKVHTIPMSPPGTGAMPSLENPMKIKCPPSKKCAHARPHEQHPHSPRATSSEGLPPGGREPHSWQGPAAGPAAMRAARSSPYHTADPRRRRGRKSSPMSPLGWLLQEAPVTGLQGSIPGSEGGRDGQAESHPRPGLLSWTARPGPAPEPQPPHLLPQIWPFPLTGRKRDKERLR